MLTVEQAVRIKRGEMGEAAVLDCAARERRWGSAVLLTSDEIRRLYRRLAPIYDLAVSPYRLLGLTRRREQAVEALRLAPGDTVLDLCCGTGLNFAPLQRAVGPSGRIIGVDLSEAMLRRARERTRRRGWENVDLVVADVASFAIPCVDGVLATFALEMVPDYDDVIARVAEALPEGGRLALLGLEHPEGWPEWLIRLGVLLNRPFGVRRAYAELQPWTAARWHLKEILHEEFLAGAAYLSVAERR